MDIALKEALKEAGRVVLIAVIPLLIDSLSKWSLDYRAVLVVAGITLLRFIDKYLHKLAPEGEAGGLTRF